MPESLREPKAPELELSPAAQARGRRGIPSADILQASSTMVGVCVTVIGLFRVFGKSHETAADNILAVDAVAFLVSAASAYGSMRLSSSRLRRLFETTADVTFMVALVVVVAVCALIAYELG
jgi:hypothetical protein